MNEFLKVAQALKTIRDQRLFRDEFLSFDEYCWAKCGRSGAEVDKWIAEADLELQVQGAKSRLQ